VNGDDDIKRVGSEDVSGAQHPGGTGVPGGNTEIMPQADASVERASGDTVGPGVIMPRPPVGPDGRPPVVRVRRSILLWMVGLLLLAILAVVGLVMTRPSGGKPVAATVTPTVATPGPVASTPGSGASIAVPTPGTNGTATPTGTGPATPGPVAGTTVTNLSALTPLQNYYAYNVTTGPEQIGTVTYPTSVRFTCGNTNANLVYNVAGYKFLTATVGVPNDATNAAGNTMTVTFFKDGSTAQLGKALIVSLDHPASVHLNLQSSSQLEIQCNATSTANHNEVNMDVALGNATIGPS
jgi:hypothetical protein